MQVIALQPVHSSRSNYTAFGIRINTNPRSVTTALHLLTYSICINIYIYTCYPPCHCLAKRQHTLSSFSRESHHPARSGHQLPWPATRKKAMRGWLFHLALEASNRDVAAQSLFVGHSRPKASVVHISKKHLESPPVLFRFPKMNQATLDRTGRAPSKTLTSNRFEVRWVRFSAIIALSASSIPNRSQV